VQSLDQNRLIVVVFVGFAVVQYTTCFEVRRFNLPDVLETVER